MLLPQDCRQATAQAANCNHYATSLFSIRIIPFKVGPVYLNHRPIQWPDGPAGVARVGSTSRHPLVLFPL